MCLHFQELADTQLEEGQSGEGVLERVSQRFDGRRTYVAIEDSVSNITTERWQPDRGYDQLEPGLKAALLPHVGRPETCA